MDDRLLFGGIALLSSCSWALGAILWRKLGEHLSAYSMNLAKTVLGSILLGIALAAGGGLTQVDSRSVLFLAASGILGIAIGDTFFFLSLLQLGPRRASLMGALNPVGIALAAAVLLGERPSPVVWSGILATSAGVGWVLRERTPEAGTVNYSRGIIYGFLSVLCTAGAVLLAKVGVSGVATIEATWIRLLAGAAGLALWGAVRSELGEWLKPFQNWIVLVKTAAVVMVVVTGGFWLSLVALKNINASIAGPLNSTGPIFILPMAYFFMDEKFSIRAILGAIIAVGGLALILTG